MMMRVELTASIVCFIFSCVVILVSNGYSSQAAAFPRAIGIIMVVLSGIYIIQVLLRKVQPQKLAGYPVIRIASFLGFLILYFVALNFLGFYTASFAFYLLITLGLSKKGSNRKDILVGVCSSIGFIGILYVLFSLLLKVQIPKGILI
jgi:hypothetical protein